MLGIISKARSFPAFEPTLTGFLLRQSVEKMSDQEICSFAAKLDLTAPVIDRRLVKIPGDSIPTALLLESPLCSDVVRIKDSRLLAAVLSSPNLDAPVAQDNAVPAHSRLHSFCNAPTAMIREILASAWPDGLSIFEKARPDLLEKFCSTLSNGHKEHVDIRFFVAHSCGRPAKDLERCLAWIVDRSVSSGIARKSPWDPPEETIKKKISSETLAAIRACSFELANPVLADLCETMGAAPNFEVARLALAAANPHIAAAEAQRARQADEETNQRIPESVRNRMPRRKPSGDATLVEQIAEEFCHFVDRFHSTSDIGLALGSGLDPKQFPGRLRQIEELFSMAIDGGFDWPGDDAVRKKSACAKLKSFHRTMKKILDPKEFLLDGATFEEAPATPSEVLAEVFCLQGHTDEAALSFISLATPSELATVAKTCQRNISSVPDNSGPIRLFDLCAMAASRSGIEMAAFLNSTIPERKKNIDPTHPLSIENIERRLIESTAAIEMADELKPPARNSVLKA